MVRVFAPLRINYGLVSTSLIITTSAISTSIIAINYDLSSALKQLLQPVIDKIQSAIKYLGLSEGLLKLKEQVKKAFQSLKTLDLLQGLKTLFKQLKGWIEYLKEKLFEWFQWEKFLKFLDWLYIVIKSIIGIANEIEWKKLLGLFFTKEFWELTGSLGWIVSKTGGLDNWGTKDFKDIADHVMKGKDEKEMKEKVDQLQKRAQEILKDLQKNDEESSSSESKKQAVKKQLLNPDSKFWQTVISRVLDISIALSSGPEEVQNNKENVDVISKGMDRIISVLWDRLTGAEQVESKE